MAESNICRLCLEQADEVIDIFSEEHGVLRVNDILSHYSIIELKPDDEISNKICWNCWTKIHGFHEFCVRVKKIQESISSIIYVDNKHDVNEVVLENVCDDGTNKGEITLIVKDEVKITIGEITCDDEDLLEMASNDVKPELKNPLISPSVYSKETANEVIEKKINTLLDKQKMLTKRSHQKTADEEETNEKLINSFFTLICELCQEEHNCCRKLFDHYEGAHKIRGFIICCEKKFFKPAKIAEHVLWHKKPELFRFMRDYFSLFRFTIPTFSRCTKCDIAEVFPDKKLLEAHMITHVDSSSRVFHCEICEKSFIKKYRFDQHKLTHLRPEEKKYICPDCAKPYATESLLRVHVRVVHMKSYAHMCEICAKVFKSRVFFEKHQLEHMGQTLPRMQCKVCNAWMKNEHTMRAHMRLHQDEGIVHECELCGKTGPSRNAILKHKRYVHFSERKFECTLCKKAFKREISLKEHMTLHTGEVLYNCTFCTKTFNSGANMFAHKKKMHHSQWKTEKEQNTHST